MNSTSKYTFGDSDRAADRLRWLARAYDDASRAFLAERAPVSPAHAVDLGCGPGHTTELLHHAVSARATTGIDASPRYVEMATARATPGIRYVVHDVLRPACPIAPSDLIFVRHLLTHLGDPQIAFRAIAELATPTGVVLVQENEILESEHPVLSRYYECVSSMQAAHGQRTHIGAVLETACRGTPLSVEHSNLRLLGQDAALMARLHRMNLSTWRNEPRAASLFDPAELDALDDGLGRIESGLDSAPPVRNGLRELVLRRASA